jgi:hypothetical protein
MLDRRLELGRLHRDDARGARPGRAGRLHRPEHVRRPPARAHSDDDVFPAEVERADVRGSGVAVVLGRLLLGRCREEAAGQQRDDLPWGRGEGRLAFGPVERCDASGGSGADVDQATTPLERVGDGLDRHHDLARGRADGVRDRLVLGEHQLDELAGRAQVVVGSGLASGLGRQLVESSVSELVSVERSGHRSTSLRGSPGGGQYHLW